MPPTCRTHYGGILIALGRWEQAEPELLAAIRRLALRTVRPGCSGCFGSPSYAFARG